MAEGGEGGGYGGGAPSAEQGGQSQGQGESQIQEQLHQTRQALAYTYGEVEELKKQIAARPTSDVDYYDKELDALKAKLSSIDELRNGMFSLAEQQQKDLQLRTEYQRAMVEQQQAEYLQASAAWVSEATAQIDRTLGDSGYPGFAQGASLVREAILNDNWADPNQRPDIYAQQLQLANDPNYWAIVYINQVFPQWHKTAREYDRMEEQRQAAQYVPYQQRGFIPRPVIK